MKKDEEKFRMAGTEGSFQYLVYVVTKLGRLGVRKLAETLRLRVEPANEEAATAIAAELTTDCGWKQPGDDGQNRFSIVITSESMESAMVHACMALGVDGDAEWNPEIPLTLRQALSPAPKIVITGNDPAVLYGEADKLEKQARNLIEKSIKTALEAKDVAARAHATRQRAGDIEEATEDFADARRRMVELGLPTANGAVAAGLGKLTKAQLLGVAEGIGLSVPKGAKKADLVGLIAGA